MKRILVVDDSKSMRQMIEMTLSPHYSVVTAEDGLEAQTIMVSETAPFDLVLTDINMPNCNGYELVKKIREDLRYKGKPILCLTTESSSDSKSLGKEAGATGWLVKPFDPTKLLQTIEKVI
jgi:two-component system chemotaxis response regulator CheY